MKATVHIDCGKWVETEGRAALPTVYMQCRLVCVASFKVIYGAIERPQTAILPVFLRPNACYVIGLLTAKNI